MRSLCAYAEQWLALSARARLSVSVAAAGLFILAPSASAQTATPTPPLECTRFVFGLSGDEEVPVVDTNAVGNATIEVDPATNELTFNIEFSNLSSSEVAAHIHGFAAVGMEADILYSLPLGSPKMGVIHFTEEQQAGILGGLTYVNIHSSNHDGGEIRGQVDDGIPVGCPARPTPTSTPTPTETPSPTVTATPALDCFQFDFDLSGGEEVPPVKTNATGHGTVGLDPATNEISFNIEFANLSSNEIAAHIHGFAPIGMEADILFTLPSGSPKIGSVTYQESQEASILAGLTYVNIHSVNFDGGEIRGQMDAPVAVVCPSPPISSTRPWTPLLLGVLVLALGTGLRRRSRHSN